MYMAKGSFRDCELDIYNEGCIPSSGYSVDWDIDFNKSTLEDLLKEISDFHGVTRDNLYMEGGKLWVSTFIAKWKVGELEIHSVTYGYDVYKSLTELQK